MKTSIVKPVLIILCVAAFTLLTQPALAGLLLNYQFETVEGDTLGSQTTPDSSSNGLTGTLKGSSTFGYPILVSSPTPLHPGSNPEKVMQFFGGGGAKNSTTMERVEVANADAGPLAASFTAFTFAAWLNPAESTAVAVIAGKTGAGGVRGWQLIRNPDVNNMNGLEFVCHDDAAGTHSEDLYVPNIFTDNTWMHLAVTFSASPDGVVPGSVAVYKDGSLVTNFPTLLTVFNGVNSAPFQVGNRGIPYNTPSWNGYIDDVRIYDTALSATEVATVAGVPEPGTLILLFAGLVGMVAVYRRQ